MSFDMTEMDNFLARAITNAREKKLFNRNFFLCCWWIIWISLRAAFYNWKSIREWTLKFFQFIVRVQLKQFRNFKNAS